MKQSTILKPCKRTTRSNPEPVSIPAHYGESFRTLEKTHGVYGIYFDGEQWKIRQVKVTLSCENHV